MLNETEHEALSASAAHILIMSSHINPLTLGGNLRLNYWDDPLTADNCKEDISLTGQKKKLRPRQRSCRFAPLKYKSDHKHKFS